MVQDLSRVEHAQERPPVISVVVPTFRRPERLRVTLEALASQTYPANALEVIVSDDGSGDATEEHVRGFSAAAPFRVKWVTGPNGGPSVARNRGIRACTGTWIAMTDDDCVPDPDWLSSHLEFLAKHPGVVGVGGAVVRYSNSVISRYVDWTRVMFPPIDRFGEAEYLVTANAVFDLQRVLAVGAFDESYKWPGGEDPDLSRRVRAAGGTLRYNRQAVVRHMHRETIKGTYRMFWHHGLGLGAVLTPDERRSHTSWGTWYKKRLAPGVKRAFKELPLHAAFVFAGLEFVRHWAFRRGVLAHARIANEGSTHTNL